MVNQAPKVSVIMNCYNSDKYLAEAINSVYAQSFKDWEIIFWDNASTDRSAEIAKSYDSKLRYFKSDKTYSLGYARNQALKEVRGEYIGFLDCDDIWLPQKLERQVEMFKEKRDLGLIFSNVEFFSSNQPSYLYFVKRNPPEGMVFGKLLEYYFLPLLAVMISRRSLQPLNDWFDESFTWAEEADLFMRIAHDNPIAYCPEVLARSRVHGQSMTYRYPELIAKEQLMLLEKFRKLWPDFEKDYAKEIATLRESVQCHLANLDWQKNDGRSARLKLKPFLRSPKRVVSYILYYFPYSILGRFKSWAKSLRHAQKGYW